MIDYSLDKPEYIIHNAHLYKLVEGEKEMRKFYDYCSKRDAMINESIMCGATRRVERSNNDKSKDN